MNTQPIDMKWGESIVVRQALLQQMSGHPIGFTHRMIGKMDYPPFLGNEDLIAWTKDVIKRQTGQEYSNVAITNGAAGAVTIALRAYAKRGMKNCLTNPAPYFSLYPDMIESAGLTHESMHPSRDLDPAKSVILLDSPSNPLGETLVPKWFSIVSMFVPTIWDSVYANKVYTGGDFDVPVHDVACGSFSKLTGINGIRLGWLATNDDLLFERLKPLVTAEYCGVSEPSTQLLLDILLQIGRKDAWEDFETSARQKLDNNREQWSKLEKFFDGQPVPKSGMFAYGPMDASAQKLFEKANISWARGSTLGTNDGFARFNLGQMNSRVKDAVERVLKIDKS